MKAKPKFTDFETLLTFLAGPRAAGQTVAMANGVFDLLHVGHVRYLEAAADLADILVVAINNDESTHRLKGPDRPVIPEMERVEMVAALGVVDAVFLFGEDDVRGILARLKPDVHVKGTDYTPESIPERDAVLAYGGRVAVAGDAKQHSTSLLLSRLSRGEK